MVDVATPVKENNDFPGVLVDLRPVTGDELRKNSVEVVTLQKNEGSFGFNIVGGTDSQHLPGEDGIFISHIKPGGSADVSGKLLPGDEIIAVNNVTLHGKTHDEVVNMLVISDEYATLVVDHETEMRILKDSETHSIMSTLTGMRTPYRTGSNILPTSQTTSPSDLPKIPKAAISEVEAVGEALNKNGPSKREAEKYFESTSSVDSTTSVKPVLPSKSYLHASSSFGSQKAEADSTTSWSRAKNYERDDDEMSTVTNASTHYYVDDVPQTPRRPVSLLDAESPYSGIIYGFVGVSVIAIVGFIIVNRLMKRGRSN